MRWRPSTISPARWIRRAWSWARSEEHTSELQSRRELVCRLLLEKKKTRHPPVRIVHCMGNHQYDDDALVALGDGIAVNRRRDHRVLRPCLYDLLLRLVPFFGVRH